MPIYSKTSGKHSAELKEFTLGKETFSFLARINLGENVHSVLCRADKGGKTDCSLIHSNNLLWYCIET